MGLAGASQPGKAGRARGAGGGAGGRFWGDCTWSVVMHCKAGRRKNGNTFDLNMERFVFLKALAHLLPQISLKSAAAAEIALSIDWAAGCSQGICVLSC